MEELSKGFTKSLYDTFSREQGSGVNVSCTHKEAVQSFVQEWHEPTFQIIDIQRFSKDTKKCYNEEEEEEECVSRNSNFAHWKSNTEFFSCFYLASSDGESIFWVLIPPHSKLEEVISNFTVDVGYCMKLREYSVLVAMNGRPVVVALEMSFSRNPLSLQGALVVDDNAFHLSPHALQNTHTAIHSTFSSSTLPTHNRCSETQNSTGERVNAHVNNNNDDDYYNTSGGKWSELENILRSSVQVDLAQLLEHPEYALSSWCITLRLIWKGEDRAIERGSRFFRKMSCLEQTRLKSNLPKQVSTTSVKYNKNTNFPGNVNNKNKMESFANCNCLLIDRNGDGIACTFYATVEFLSEIDVDDCLQIANPEIVWGTSSENAVSQLRIYERNVYCNHADQLPSVLPTFPYQASRFVGSAGSNIMSIASILAECGIDDVVSVIGKVIVVSDEVQVHTKRGRVIRRTISLEDLTQRGCLIDLTLWGNLASKVEINEGEVWTVMDCTVREFMRRKTLSSRASTALAHMNAQNLYKNYSNGNTDAKCSNYNEGMTVEKQITIAENLQKNVNESKSNWRNESHHILPYDLHTQTQNTSVILSNSDSLKNLDVSTPQLCINTNSINEQVPLLLRICEIELCECEPNTLQKNTEHEPSTVRNQTDNNEGLSKEIRESEVTVMLSDGHCCLSVVTQMNQMVALSDSNNDADEDADNGELEICTRLQQTNNSSQLISKLNQELVGCAILAWVSRREHSNALILTRCRHVNFAACAGVVLNEIESHMRK